MNDWAKISLRFQIPNSKFQIPIPDSRLRKKSCRKSLAEKEILQMSVFAFGIWNLEFGILRVHNESMRYQRFEDLPVWKEAIELAVVVHKLTAQPEFKSKFSLKDQIERAAVSVSNNIAEGFERGTNNELLMFLYIARGSAGETRSMCCLFLRLPDLSRLAEDIRKIHSKAESCSRQLKSWAEAIQNSKYKGERYVNESLKRSEIATREREDFLHNLAIIREENIARTRNAANQSKAS